MTPSVTCSCHTLSKKKKTRRVYERTYVHIRAVHKETNFFICCFTYNPIKLVSFKVLPSTLDTLRPTFFPVLERVLERVLRNGAKVPYRIFYYLFYGLKSATFQWGFLTSVTRKSPQGPNLRVGSLGDKSRLMFRQKFTVNEWRVSRCIVMVQHPGLL